MKPYLKDPKTNEYSVTMTLLVIGTAVALLKMVGSGMSLGGLTLDKFSGTDFAAAVGALGAIYAARKHTDSK